MIVDIPLNYQPTVGERITVTLSGRVNSIRIDPTAPATVVVTLETADNEQAGYVGPGQRQRLDPTMPVNAMGGNTF